MWTARGTLPLLFLLAACVGAGDDRTGSGGSANAPGGAGDAAERTEVWTDGSLDDWSGVAPAVVDPKGDAPAGSPVDLGAVAIQDDRRFLHILADLGDTVTVLGMRGSVEIVLDVDGDAESGGRYGGMDGADLVVILSLPTDPPHQGHGLGVGIRHVSERGVGPIESADAIGLLLAPTHSADHFEIRMDRTGLARISRANNALSTMAGRVADSRTDSLPRRSQPVAGRASAGEGRRSPDPAGGQRVRGRLRYLLEGNPVDETAIFTHLLATEPGPDPPLLGADALARSPETLRVVAWNVSSVSFRFNRDAFRRVLKALDPDVLLLDELHSSVSLDDLTRFGPHSPDDPRAQPGGVAGTRGSWRWWLATGGGRQRTAVGARGLPLRGAPEMSRIDHDADALARWLAAVGNEPEAPGMPTPETLAETEAAGGLSATGAWVTVEGREVLFVPVDLQSAGYDGSPRDRLRELQARRLNRAIEAALAGKPQAGLVVAGDLNLVGSIRPLEALRRGVGVGGQDLDVARPVRLRDRSLSTWRSIWGDDPFSPGRLDFLLYRGAVMQVARAFVFDAADLSAQARAALQLLPSDTEKSDHLPLVVDFALR